MFGASWTTGNQILFASPQKGKGILSVSANGGKPQPLITAKPDEIMHGPQLLPDGDHVLYTVSKADGLDRWDKAQIVVESLKSHDRKVVIEGGADGRYLPTGQIIYALDVPVIENVERGVNSSGVAHMAVANNGSMVYLIGATGGAQQNPKLALVDRSGKQKQLAAPPGRYAATADLTRRPADCGHEGR
jgi:hypothetical protein